MGPRRRPREERPIVDVCRGLRGTERDVCIFVKSREGPTSILDLAHQFRLGPGEAAAIVTKLRRRGIVKWVPVPPGEIP